LKSRYLTIALATIAIGLLAFVLWRSGAFFATPKATQQVATQAVAPARPAGYVGSQACAKCHANETAAWSGSQHAVAMQLADERTVLGNFKDASFEHYGVTSRFFRRDGRFIVRTDGPDGKLSDFEVRNTFGVYPLQQYLVDIGRGRLQALPLAWDTRPKAEGGQRWFHLYPNERIDYTDELHWTRLRGLPRPRLRPHRVGQRPGRRIDRGLGRPHRSF
jgi:hypothetical protein